MSAHIVASDALCALGSGPDQIWASVRAGITRIGAAHVLDKHFESIRMGLVPEAALPPLPPEIDALPLPHRARRMLRLGAPSLAAVAADAGSEPVRLFLALPQIDAREEPWISSFALHLARMAKVPLDAPNCRVLPAGRAAGLMVLEHALAALAADPSRRVVVGGVDTYFDLKLLSGLDHDGRLLGSRSMDGFIPGEAAAFYVLGAEDVAKPGRRPVRLLGAASARDAGHRGGTEPARGEGLADAIEKLRSAVGQLPSPVSSTFAGLNGEAFEAKLWGVAALRHRDFFAPEMPIQHPADACGDTGAAAGALLVVLAATALANGHRPAPALVWAASDHEPRACALLGS